MASPLETLEPRSLWRHFDEIRKIPHPSGKEGRLRDHIKAVAADQGFEVLQDDAGNICVKVPATAGHEEAPTIVLQGHMDMVCEKNSGTDFDFDADPIEVAVDGDWVTAEGTTLGADNGLGLAAALAAATDESVVHGPLELLFTVDEETGLTGAMQLDASMLSGRKLLNLDSEDDGVLFVGCAGGQNVTLRLPLERTAPPEGTAVTITVRGLRGGHSGLDIGENRGNAIRILARTLETLGAAGSFAVASFSGGSAHNAIPREANATVVAPTEAAERAIAASLEAARGEYGAVEDKLVIESARAPFPAEVLIEVAAAKVLDLLRALPHGAQAMSRDIPGLVETSDNLATVSTEGAACEVLLSVRSSVAPALDSTVGQIRSIARLAGAEIDEHAGYPGWQPNMNSDLLALARTVFTDIWGHDPKVTAIHAGLECGLIGEKTPGIDMISFGPELEAVHSPDERAQISSSARFFEALKGMLAKLA